MCGNTYLNIPHPKLQKPCLYKSERGEEEGGRKKKSDKGRGQKVRRMTEGVREEEKEEEKDGWGTNEEEKKKISLLCSCCRGNAVDNT